MANTSPAPSAPTNQFNKIRLKKPLDVWSTREKLCLASAVYKIGDQNWVSVSRAIRPYAEPNRPPDWFHQKNCVLQYYDMLEQLEQPKRKRGDRAETDTPSLQIMRKMTIERSEQLKKEIMELPQEFKQLKSEAEEIEAGEWDDRLEEEWAKINVEEKVKEEDIKVEVMDTDQEDIETVEGFIADMDENTQDSVGENVDISVLIDEESSQSSKISTPQASTPVDVSNKLPASSHLLSSLLQSNMKTANELQQLKMEQEQENVQQQAQASLPLISSQNQRSLLKTISAQDIQQLTTSNTINVTDTKPDLEDSHVDVTTDVIEETVVEEMDNSSLVTETTVKTEHVDVVSKDDGEETISNCPVVEVVEEEVIGVEETVKTEDEAVEVIVEEDAKDATTELDVEGLDVKEEVEKDSQDEDETVLKQLPESIASGTETELVDTVLKIEPLSPTSSISSRISESGSKRGRSRGRPKGSRSRVSGRKSYTDDERKEDVSSTRLSDVELSEEDLLDKEDLLSGGLAASATGSILSESFPNSPASLSICSDTEEEKSYKQWKKSILLVWREAATHKYANVFLHPVTDDIAPGYNSVVLRPMDLSTIKKNVETGAIRATVEFQRDLMLMFSNAIMYNSSDHNVYKMATEMYDDVMQHIEIMVQTSDAKNLRQSRRPDASDKEEDSKKRRLSVDQPEGGKTKKRKTRLEEPIP